MIPLSEANDVSIEFAVDASDNKKDASAEAMKQVNSSKNLPPAPEDVKRVSSTKSWERVSSSKYLSMSPTMKRVSSTKPTLAASTMKRVSSTKSISPESKVVQEERVQEDDSVHAEDSPRAPVPMESKSKTSGTAPDEEKEEVEMTELDSKDKSLSKTGHRNWGSVQGLKPKAVKEEVSLSVAGLLSSSSLVQI